MILVTGGAGFIGSNFILDWLAQSDEAIINLDKLTYAGNLQNLAGLMDDIRHVFVQGDIGDVELMSNLMAQYQPRAVINFAAESHVDRSIHGPVPFIQTNIVGTFRLLETVYAHWKTLDQSSKNSFRFLHVSTDEVYGSLNRDEAAFTETHRYQPSSPYSASKAAAMVVANFLLSPEAQLSKAQPANWGDLPVLDPGLMPADARTQFDAIPRGIATLSTAELAAHRLPELQAPWITAFEQGWEASVLSNNQP